METVDLSPVKKQLRRVPRDVIKRIQRWVSYVEAQGMREVRKIPGLHDEPLTGRRKGYRSVRLGRSWRAIYREHHKDGVAIIRVEEVSNHEY